MAGRPTPAAWLDACARGWLLSSEDAFRARVLSPKRAARAVREHARASLRPAARGLSFATLDLAIERAWEAPSLDALLFAWGASARADRERWRWATLAVPADLLGGPPPGYAHDAPIANVHVHLGAARTFERAWSVAMTRPVSPRDLDGHAIPFGGAEAFAKRLAQAAIARLVLAHLSASTTAPPLPALLDALARRTGAEHDVLLGALGALTLAGDGPPWARLSNAFDRLRVSLVADELDADPLERLVHDELAMTRVLRSRLDGAETPLAHLFWQYQRVRAIAHRWLVLEPGTAGLGWFSEHARRARVIRPARFDFQRAVRDALALEVPSGAPAYSLELRASPEATLLAVPALARVAREQLGHRDRGSLEVGIVVHLIKRGAEARPSRNADSGARYGSWYARQVGELDRLVKRMRSAPAWLALVRGFDAASDELTLPTWALSPLYERGRSELARIAPHPNWRPRMTAHAGEDFRTLVEGLRRVDDLLRYGLLQAEDRIGHALALGVDPAHWTQRDGLALQPAEERLFDLLWLRRHVPGAVGCSAELSTLALEIFGSVPPHEVELARLYDDLHATAALAAVGYPYCRGRRAVNAREALLLRYLTDDELQRRGATPREPAPLPAALLRAAQDLVAKAVRRQRITVEANPTSNLLIGDFGGAHELPLVRMKRRHRLRVALGDDDPITFATSLADEYAYVRAALEASLGLPRAERLASTMARQSWKVRFTLAESASRRLLDAIAAG